MAARPLSLADMPPDFSLSFWPNNLSLRQRQRGKLFQREQYLRSVSLSSATNGDIEINASVFRSMAKNAEPHKVFLSVGKSQVSEARCSCKAGIRGDCAHTIAVMMTIEEWMLLGMKDVPQEPSCTSLPCQWNVPRGKKIGPSPVTTMIITNPGNTDRKRKPFTADFTDNRKFKLDNARMEKLRSIVPSGAAYLLPADIDQLENIPTQFGDMPLGSPLQYKASLINMDQQYAAMTKSAFKCGNLVFPKQTHIQADVDLTLLHVRKVIVNQSEAEEIERVTRGQSNSPEWFKGREVRLTASNFGRVMKRQKDISEAFLKSLFQQQVFSSAATSYGKSTEAVARQLFVARTGCHAHDCGLVINPAFPYLGASPDAMVCDKDETGILEIKCPYSARDMLLATAIQELGAKFCLTYNSSNSLILKTSHDYWYQVQGQLLVTGAPFCDFMVYTKRDSAVIRIRPDKPTMTNLFSKLTDFYFTSALPFLMTMH